MTFDLTRKVIEMRETATGRHLSSSDKLILLLLADRHNQREGAAWPSIRRLAEDAGSSESTVRRSLQRLEADGVIAVRHRYRPRVGASRRKGEQTSSAYYFNGYDDVPPSEAWILAPSSGTGVGTVQQDQTSADVDDLPGATRAETGLNVENVVAALTEWLDSEMDGQTGAADFYRDALAAADETVTELNGDHSMQRKLHLAVVGHAARTLLDADDRAVRRIEVTSKLLGDPSWLLLGILYSADADVQGDRTSYAIATSKRIKAESAEQVAA